MCGSFNSPFSHFLDEIIKAETLHNLAKTVTVAELELEFWSLDRYN